MIAEAMEKVAEMAKPEIIEAGGREYSSKPLYPVEDPIPKLVRNVHTLTGLVDYLHHNVDQLNVLSLMIHIESPTSVQLYSGLHGDFLVRANLMTVQADVPDISFGRYQDAEGFIIMLQSMFHPGPDRDNTLRIVGNLKDSAIKTFADDGMTQQVTVKQGITSVGEEVIHNPIALQPFRSFMEIEQPESAFILRMESGPIGGLPLCCLFEADGGAWRLDAIKRIRDWLATQMAEKVTHASESIAIIA